VLRCVGDDLEVRSFSVWTPMAIAAIRSLPGTIEHRAVVTQNEHGIGRTTTRMPTDCSPLLEEVRQLGDIRRDPPRLVLRE